MISRRCLKNRYLSEKIAITHLIKVKTFESRKERIRRLACGLSELHVYECRKCGWWHLGHHRIVRPEYEIAFCEPRRAAAI